MKQLKIIPRKDYPLYIVLGALCLLAAFVLFPLWAKTDVFFATWGMAVVKLLIAAVLIAYLAMYLWRKIEHGNGVIRMLSVIEFVLLSMIALGCVLSRFNILKITSTCAILGLALFCRGTIEVFRAYYHQRDSVSKYPIWRLVIAILMIALGTYCFAKPLFSDVVLLWIFVVLLIVGGAFLICYGVACRPRKRTSSRKK